MSLFAVIRSLEEMESFTSQVDGIELRLDLFEEIDIQALKRALPPDKQLLFTLRTLLPKVEELLALRPDYVDLEMGVEEASLRRLKRKFPHICFIGSFHDFEKTPEHLEELFSCAQEKGFDLCKLATLARSALDGMRMLSFIQKHLGKVIGIAMGEKGQFTRVLGKKYGNPITYAAVSQDVAPWQLSVEELEEIYHVSKINTETQVYGLIGEVVSKSPGHLAHNFAMQELGWNAVYVKIPLVTEELGSFLQYAQELGWCGLSVTMPLKEKVARFVEVGKEEAVNTLVWKEGKLVGLNTDGKGALEAIEETMGSIAGKRVVLLGYGGAAKAIAQEAKARGAELLVLGRDGEKAERVAGQIGARGGSLDQIQGETYEVLINATSHPSPMRSAEVPSDVVFLEVEISPKEESLFSHLQQRGICVISGLEMFLNQGASQEVIWMQTYAPHLLRRDLISSQALKQADLTQAENRSKRLMRSALGAFCGAAPSGRLAR